MARVQRFDFGQLAPAKERPNGWLELEGRSARVGILQYPQADGTMVNELVLPEELFNAESMASAHMVPVTNDHPSALLDGKTATSHQVGSVGQNLRADGDYLSVPMMVTDGKTAAAVKNGKQELSWGYDAEIDPPDPALVGKWGPHDGIQRQRRYNHLAIVDAARAGSQARVRLDSTGNAHLVANNITCVVTSPTQMEIQPMPTLIRVDGATFPADETNARAIEQAIEATINKARTDAASAVAAEKARADAAVTQANTVKAKLDTVGANVAKNWKRIKTKFDVMMKRMATCDECKGGKMVDGMKCPSCDGFGSYSARDAMKEEPVAEEMEADGLSMMEAPPEDEPLDGMDPPGLIAAEHKDSKVGKVLAAAAQKRRDGMARVSKRDTAARVTFETGARKYLGADAKLDGKEEGEIRAMVLGKIKSAFKLDGLSAAEVEIAYKMALAEVPAAERNDGMPIVTEVRTDGDAFDVAKASKVYSDNLKKQSARAKA